MPSKPATTRAAQRATQPGAKSAAADKALANAIRKLRKMPSGFITDSMTRLAIGGWMDEVLPVQTKGRFVGPAVTLRWAPARNAGTASMNIYDFIRTCRPGQVLVMETGVADGWIMGENMAHHGQYQKLAAMVTDSNVRDYLEIAAMKIPVFSRGPAIRRAPVELVGLNVPVTCGGTQVAPGDLVVGDPDGIAVIPAARIADVLYQAEDIAKLEAEQEKAIRAGVTMDKLNAIIAKKKILRK